MILRGDGRTGHKAMFILIASLLTFTADSTKEADYITPIEHWIDSTMSGYDDDYDRMMEIGHLRKQNHADGCAGATYWESPFEKRFIDA